MTSKLGVLVERGIKKSKKRQVIALAALGGCGGLGQLWEALAGLWEALGQRWEGLEERWDSSGSLFCDKLPINRTSGRYVNKTLHRSVTRVTCAVKS